MPCESSRRQSSISKNVERLSASNTKRERELETRSIRNVNNGTTRRDQEGVVVGFHGGSRAK